MTTATPPRVFELVDQFHREFGDADGAQAKTELVSRYLAILTHRGDDIASDAEAIGIASAFEMQAGANATLKALMSISKTFNGSAENRRKERAIKTLVACWSWIRVRHYQWQLYPYKTLEALVVGAKRFPSWHVFVAAANHQLLSRHERSVKAQNVLRIGQHHPASCVQIATSPLERSDMVGLTTSSDAEMKETEKRIGRWIGPCLCLNATFNGDDKRLQLWLLDIDEYGMLIPSQHTAFSEYQTCGSCSLTRPQTSVLRLPGYPMDLGRSDSPTSPPESDTSSDFDILPDIESSSLPSDSYPGPGGRDEECGGESLLSSPATASLPSSELSLNPSADSAADILEHSIDTSGTPRITSISPTSSRAISGNSEGLFILTSPVTNGDSRYIEQKILQKYHESFRKYYERTQVEAAQGPLYKTRSEWYTSDTQHAKVWCPAECGLGIGSATCERDADIWHYTMEVFVRHSIVGKAFIRPVLIKGNEKSADLEYHTQANFLEFMRCVYQRRLLDVQCLERKGALSMPFSRFRAELEQGTGLKALNLRNFTRAHRPPFTMLPRYRLLDILIGRDETEAGTVSRPIDVSRCAEGFNICAAANAFSGAHQDALGFTWVRNLEGLKFWMTVHPSSMTDNWAEFHCQGPDWIPQGKATLTVIEKGDILVMMPDEFDRATVHAVHSPEASLMEGAMFFDKLRILSTLNCLHDIGQNQNSANGGISSQLPFVMRELESLVQAEMSTAPDDAFYTAFTTAMRRLEDLGCACSTTANQESCQ